jgi:outer membrane protein
MPRLAWKHRPLPRYKFVKPIMRKILIPFFFLFAVPASSQRILSLEEAIAIALQNNYDIQISKNDSSVAALDYSFRQGAFMPRLTGNFGITWNDNDQKQEFNTGVVRKGSVKTNNFNTSLNLNWTLFDGLKMFVSRDKVAEFIKLGELGIKNQVINTIAEVINTYYNIVRQKQQLKAIEEQMNLSQERVKLAQYKLDIGVGTKPDVLQSKVDLNAQKAAQLNQQNLIAQLKDQLDQLMKPNNGLQASKQNASFDVADSIPINTGLSLGDIQNNIEGNNFTLMIAKKNIDIAGLTLKERKADRFPVVSFNSAYNFNRTDNTLALNPALPLFTRNLGFNYGITASVPILNNLNIKRQIKQAQLNIQYQQLVYDNQKSLINLSILNAFTDYEQQKKTLKLEEENILLAKENVDIIMQVYKLNSTTYIQLREAQKSLEDAYNRLIAARYNTKLAETELLRLKGDLVK